MTTVTEGGTYATTRGTFLVRELRRWRGEVTSVVAVLPSGGVAVYAYSDVLTWNPVRVPPMTRNGVPIAAE